MKSLFKYLCIFAATVILLLATLAALCCAYSEKIERWFAKEGLQLLAEELDTKVEADSLGLSFARGQVVLYGFRMDDRKHVRMLEVDTLEAEIDLQEILRNKITVEGVKLAGAKAVLYKERKDTAANYQFFLDTFKNKNKTKDTKKKRKGRWIDLNLKYADFKRLSMKWDVLNMPMKGGDTLDVNHLWLEDMGVSLKGQLMQEKTINANLERLQAKEKKAGINFSLEKADVSYVEQRNTVVNLNNLKANYLDKRVSFKHLQLTQRGETFTLADNFSLKVDSLKYFCNNGKPRKNHDRPNRGAFDPGHLDAVMNAELMLHGMKNDTLHGSIAHLWAYDKGSGLLIKNLTSFFFIDENDINLTNTKIRLQNSLIEMKKVCLKYKVTPGNKEKGIKTKVDVNLTPTRLTANVILKDIAKPFAPRLSNFTTPLRLSVDVAGNLDKFTFNNIRINTRDNKLTVTANGDLCNVAKKKLLCLHFNNIILKANSNSKDRILRHFAKKVNIKMTQQIKAVGDIYYTGKLGVFYKRIDLGGTLFTKFGNLTFGFTINGFTKYMTGNMNSNALDLGTLMEVKALGPIAADATFSFDLASKKTAIKLGRKPGKLPRGWMKAHIRNAKYNFISFKHINAEIKSDGTTADGLLLIPQGPFDIMALFQYIQTADEQTLKVKPALKKHRTNGMSLTEALQNEEEKQKAKEEKKAKKEAKKAEKELRKAEKKAKKENINQPNN